MELQNKGRPRGKPAILVIRRNRLGDMICTLPLLEALRRHYPQAHLAVACDDLGACATRASAAVNETIVLPPGRLRWLAFWRAVFLLRGFDIVIAAKGGFDRRLARLTWFTRARRRIGFDKPRSLYYTDPVTPPSRREHQVDTQLRLLAPLGVSAENLPQPELRVPDSSRAFADKILAEPPFSGGNRFALINLSSTSPLRFHSADFLELVARLLATTDLAVAFVSAPADREQAQSLAAQAESDRVTAVATAAPLDLLALIGRASFFLTPEGGAAHLASTSHTPTVVLWSEGPFDKWQSRGAHHVFVRAGLTEPVVPVERVWAAIEPLLSPARTEH